MVKQQDNDGLAITPEGDIEILEGEPLPPEELHSGTDMDTLNIATNTKGELVHKDDLKPAQTEPKRSALKVIRKWTEYSRKLSERGLRPAQIKAIKVFICLPVKTVVEWADKAGVARTTLSSWWNHDKLFQECLYEAACDFLDKVIPFGMIHLGEKVMKGEESSLMNALRLRGRLEPKQEGKNVYKRFIAEWLQPE